MKKFGIHPNRLINRLLRHYQHELACVARGVRVRSYQNIGTDVPVDFGATLHSSGVIELNLKICDRELMTMMQQCRRKEAITNAILDAIAECQITAIRCSQLPELASWRTEVDTIVRYIVRLLSIIHSYIDAIQIIAPRKGALPPELEARASVLSQENADWLIASIVSLSQFPGLVPMKTEIDQNLSNEVQELREFFQPIVGPLMQEAGGSLHPCALDWAFAPYGEPYPHASEGVIECLQERKGELCFKSRKRQVLCDTKRRDVPMKLRHSILSHLAGSDAWKLEVIEKLTWLVTERRYNALFNIYAKVYPYEALDSTVVIDTILEEFQNDVDRKRIRRNRGEKL